MTAQEYLGQAYRLDQHINSKLQQIESLRSLAEKITVSYGGESVTHTRNVTSMEGIITKLIDAEQALKNEIDQMVETKVDIAETIALVRNENYRLILEKRYLCFMDWDCIARDLNCTRRWALVMHERAVDVVKKLLERKGTTE